jgi:hypothetical protein
MSGSRGAACRRVDNGAPGIRPEHSERCNGAFVTDPDGNIVEAVHVGS